MLFPTNAVAVLYGPFQAGLTLGKEHAVRTLEGVLAKHPFFSGLDERYLQLVVGCAANVRFNAGELIFRQGRQANDFYLIRAGKVALEISVPVAGTSRFRPSERAKSSAGHA